MALIKPKAIGPGATIGIVSPSSPISRESLEKGLEPFRERGYNIVYGKHVLDSKGYLAGEDEARADDLHEMFSRSDVDAVLCSRGGFGAARLLPYLQADLFRNNPKILAGYSDVTVLNLYFQEVVGMVSLYSPMPITFARGIPQPIVDEFWRAFERPEPLGALPGVEAEIKTVVAGKARGVVTGGCLCLMTYSLGTPFELQTEGRIVVIEDVDEAPYRIDGMLTQLGQAGKFSHCAGIVIGEDTRWEEHIDKENPNATLTPDFLWADRLAGFGKPTVTGFPFGHVNGPLTLPIGVEAELDTATGTLTYLESATV